MKPGTLCITSIKNYAPSLYRNKDEFDQYYWAGLTPNHSHGFLEPKAIIFFLKKVVWDCVVLAEIIHDGRVFYIQNQFIQEIGENVNGINKGCGRNRLNAVKSQNTVNT